MANFNPTEHITSLKGKDYLEVKWRLAWFRAEHPHGKIETTLLHIDHEQGLAVFKATVDDGEGGRAEGHGSESRRDFGDFIEKAETKSIGRALAALGYGTQFAPELEELPRVVDAPVERKPAPQPQEPASIPASAAQQKTPATTGQQQAATEQQIASIKKLHERLKKPLPANLAALSYSAAAKQITALSAEYRKATAKAS